MQCTRSIERVAHITRSAAIDIVWSGTAVTKATVLSTSNEADLIADLAITNPGTGRYGIAWTAGTLPPRTIHSRAFILEGAGMMCNVTDESSNSLEVVVYDAAGSVTAGAVTFSVDIYGEG
jgi:hypothetical protein